MAKINKKIIIIQWAEQKKVQSQQYRDHNKNSDF